MRSFLPSRRGQARAFIRRACLAVLSTTVLLAVSSTTAAYADVAAVNLSCNDGTNLNQTLDLASIQALDSALQAMVLYPAGLTCSLSQSTDPGSGNPHYEYSVGGGQAFIVTRCMPEETNFALSARVTPDAESQPNGAGGHINLSIPDCTSTSTTMTYGPSDLRAEVDCLSVHPGPDGLEAVLTARVTSATGVFGNNLEFPPNGLQGREISIANDDSGLPGGIQDAIGWDFGTATASCSPTGESTAEASEVTVDRGNITNHYIS